MKTVTVPALKAFEYRGRAYQPGDAVTMVPVEAAAHSRQGNVSLQHGSGSPFIENRQMVPETRESVPVRRRPGRPRKAKTAEKTPEPSDRTYRRRDMTSADDT